MDETSALDTYLKTILSAVLYILGATLKFFFAKGLQLIAPTLKVIQNKGMQLLYRAKIWGWNEKILNQLEIIQNKFFRKIFGLLQETPVAHLKSEVGLPSITIRVHLKLLVVQFAASVLQFYS